MVSESIRCYIRRVPHEVHYDIALRWKARADCRYKATSNIPRLLQSPYSHFVDDTPIGNITYLRAFPKSPAEKSFNDTTVYALITACLVAASYAAILPRDQCCLGVSASGLVSGSLGQLSNGQNRVSDGKVDNPDAQSLHQR